FRGPRLKIESCSGSNFERRLVQRMIMFLATLCLGLITTLGAGAKADKKLIEFGWDEPDTGFMRQHAAEMERSPFDGCVFHVEAQKPGGGSQANFTWGEWGNRSFTDDELEAALGDLTPPRIR